MSSPRAKNCDVSCASTVVVCKTVSTVFDPSWNVLVMALGVAFLHLKAYFSDSSSEGSCVDYKEQLK